MMYEQRERERERWLWFSFMTDLAMVDTYWFLQLVACSFSWLHLFARLSQSAKRWLPSTFPFEIKCVTLQRAHVLCHGGDCCQDRQEWPLLVIWVNSIALHFHRAKKKITNKPNCVWREKPLLYNSVRPFYSLSVWEVSSFSMWKCA